MQCPNCPVSTVRLEVGRIELDECPRCLGMWFDPGELQQVLAEALSLTSLQQRFAPREAEAEVTRGACPRCVVSRLQPREHGGHQVAGCGQCGGVWLSAPVLSSLLALEAPAWESPSHQVLPSADPGLRAVEAGLAPHQAMESATDPGLRAVETGRAPRQAMQAATDPGLRTAEAGPVPPPAHPPDVPPPRAASSRPLTRQAQPPAGAAPRSETAMPQPHAQPPAVPAPRASTAGARATAAAAAEVAPAPANALLNTTCVACAGWMDPVTHEGLAFHECTQCRAAYFPRAGLPAFLSHHPERWPVPDSDGAEPGADSQCPACSQALERINWQGRGARVLACPHCWGTFVSAGALRRLLRPEAFHEAPLDGGALFIWRVFDKLTDLLTLPAHKRRR